MSESTAELEILSASKSFDSRVILDEISIKIPRGEFTVICGRSGSGKSTLLRLLAGLLKPDCGKLLWRGQEISQPPEEASLVTQNYSASLLPWLTVERNVALPLLKYRLGKEALRERTHAVLAKVGLSDRKKSYPLDLSGGMQQRVALARALITNPSILFLDEPFASVDAIVRLELEDLLANFVSDSFITTILVTHDLDEAIYLADRILVLSEEVARVTKEINVKLERPRNQIVTKSDMEFLKLRNDLFTSLGRN